MKKLTFLFFVIGILAGLAVVVFVLYPLLRPYSFHGTVLQSVDLAPGFEEGVDPFTLMDSTGQPLDLSNFEGKLVLLYFGYTFCPDVCPATLSELAKAMAILGEDASQVQVIMISIDPERDTPEEVGAFITHFNPYFLGAVGSPEDTATIAALYGIYYAKHEGTSATGYLMAHTATVLVIDRSGHLKLVLPFGVTGEDIASDLAYMLR